MKSHDYKHKHLFFVALLFLSATLSAQRTSFPIKTGGKQTKTLKGGETHDFQLSLKKGYIFRAEAFQNGIDIIIRAFDPAGVAIGEFDSPNGTQGPEPIQFTTKTSGTYRLSISALEENAASGEYTLRINQAEKQAKSLEGKVDQLFAAWNVPGSPGAALAVLKDGKLHYAKGYGYAQLEYDIPITSKSVFHIASVSKQFTAFAITMLAEQGKLSLDDDIRKYLPEMFDFGKTITIRHLIHHTSGLRDQWNLLALAGWRLDDVITKDQVLKLIFNQRELNFEPGAEYVYCNTGYTLMAEIVARVSGQSFPDYCQEFIFKPLGMNNTLFYDDHEKIVKNRAYSYSPDQVGFKKSVLSYANVGATSLFTTVEDLTRWADNFKHLKVGTPNIMANMHSRGVLNSGDTLTYAFGQDISKYKGLNMVSHSGGDAGYRTYLARFPDQDFAVVVFSNLASFNPVGMALQVAEIYLGDQMTQPAPPPAAPLADNNAEAEPTPDAETWKDYIGKYELQPGFIISITVEDNKLMGQATGQEKFPLQFEETHTFSFKPAGITVVFEKPANAEFYQLILKQGGGQFTCPRVEEFDASKINFEELIGKYYSPELETAYTFFLKDGKLMARHQRHPDSEIIASKKDFFFSNNWFLGQIEMTRNSEGQISGMKVSSGRVRGVFFEKMK